MWLLCRSHNQAGLSEMEIYLKSVPVTNRLLKSRIAGGRVLDVGGAPMPSRGTSLLANGCDVTIADPDEPKAPMDPGVRHLRMRVEDLTTALGLYDHIVLSNVLEHVESPLVAVRACMRVLEHGGQCHVLTPNCETLNRRIGVRMGILKSIREIPEKEVAIGHIHTFTVAEMRRLLEDGGLHVLECFGILLKLAPTPEMIKWPEERIQACFDIASEMPPEICHEVYFRAVKQ